MNFFDISIVAEPADPVNGIICDNILTITGPDSELIKFAKRAKGEYYNTRTIVFDNFVKTPTGLSSIDTYKWRIEHWGVRVTPPIAKFNQRFNWLEIRFMTVWTPPIPFMITVSSMFKKLKFELLFNDQTSCHRLLFNNKVIEQAEEPIDRVFWQEFMK